MLKPRNEIWINFQMCVDSLFFVYKVKDNISEWEIHGWKYVAKFDSLGPILQDDGLRVTNPKNKDSDITGFWVLPGLYT